MGEEVGASSARSRPGSSIVKSKDVAAAKKRAALWKKQVKCFKLKDVGKKVDAVRFCTQDERFFREQAEVLPQLVGFLSRTKTPELVMETLAVMQTLLSQPSTVTETSEPDAEVHVIHPELNAGFMLERSMSADSPWKAGEPFINLFSMNSLASEIRIKAIEVYDLLLRASVVLAASVGEATPTLLQFQSVGSPCSALLGCLVVDNGDLQFAALSGLRSLMRNPPNEEFLSKFEAEKGISRLLEFVCHLERRYHRPALDILESFSHFECGREHLKKNSADRVLRDAIQEAQQTIKKTSAIIPASGMDASPISAKDAPLLCSNIGVLCQVLVRSTLAQEQVASNPVEDSHTLFMDVICAMVDILRYDITSALNPVPVPIESPRTTGGAAAAAAAAANAVAINAAALAALFPFSIDRCVAIISSLGRMIEHSEQCKAHAKALGVLPVLLDCFKVKDADNLHQVADKLLHLCVHIRNDTPQSLNREFLQQHENGIDGEEDKQQPELEFTVRIDPQILCAVVSGNVEPSGADNVDVVDDASIPAYQEKPPLVAVDTLLSLLEASQAIANKVLVFRHLRWIAALVDFPGNAIVLGERAVELFLQILATASPDDKLLYAFVSKCIHSIVLQNSGALELCGSGGHEPSTAFFSFLEQTSEHKNVSETLANDADSTFLSQHVELDASKDGQPDKAKNESEPSDDSCKLEWIDEFEEETAFEPKPLTESIHNVDAFLAVAEALTGLTNAFLKWNPTASGSCAIDFSELVAARHDTEHISTGKAGGPPTAGSKKKLATDQAKPSVVGEAVMLCILEKGMQAPKLISKYAAINPQVCVSMLGLLNNLMTVPSGMKVLLNLAKIELQATTTANLEADSTSSFSAVQWPLSVELSSQMEHTLLLLPVLNVLQSPDTSFMEIEAAVRSIAVMTIELEHSVQELLAPAPEPVVEPVKSPAKGGAAAAPAPPAAPTIPELVVTESDRFINVALGCGALVILLSFMDHARLPRGTDDFSNRASAMRTRIEEMLQTFITLAQVKQGEILIKYQEKLELMQPPLTESGTVSEIDANVELPYQARWAQLILDHKFTVPRFGYESYSALLLASELALPTLVSTLLNVGASPEIASPEGLTPLMLAFLVGNEEMVIDLLDARANVDAITTDGQDLTVWNCALVSPVKTQVSDLITKAYANSEGNVSTMNVHIELDSIEGSLQFLDMCLDAEVDADISNAQGDFLLHSLLSKSIVRRKLRGLDLCFRYNSYYEDSKSLQRAVFDLIQVHSANVNSCNRKGQTPLHLALLYGYTGIAEILLNHGANPNIQGIYGHLPLHYACLGFCGNLDGSDGEAIKIIRLLLEHASKYTCYVGAHIDRRKHKSEAEKQALAIDNILEKGLQSVIEPPSIVLKLADAQQVLTTPSFMGTFLPWHFACGAYIQLSSVLCLDDEMQRWFEANGEARADVLRYLIRDWKIDISATGSDGVTALHLAVKSDVNGSNIPVVDLLLENCATLNVNSVHDHILIDSLPIIPSGAQVVLMDTFDDRKQAYVSSRSIDGKYHVILADGQHVDDVSRDKLQVIYDPGKRGGPHHSHHYKYLLPMESRFAALHYALQANHDIFALKLLALPAISLDPEGSDLPLLALACAARQSPEVVRRLITQQANMRVQLPLRTSKCELMEVDVNTSSSIANRKHAAALHYAVMYDDFDMVEGLLASPDGHVQPNVSRSRDGYTPLHLACQMEDMRIIKLLLDHGANLTQMSTMSTHGVSPLQLLMKFDSLENDKLKELISENYVRPEMLMESCVEQQEVSTKSDRQPTDEDQNYDGDGNEAPSCAVLLEEELNLNLFERLQGLKKGGNDELRRRLESKLQKSDAILRLFFDVIKRSPDSDNNDQQKENGMESRSSTLIEFFQQLCHRHDCYRQFIARSQWKPKGKILRAVSKSTLDEVIAEQL